jgi:hypothetical protein
MFGRRGRDEGVVDGAASDAIDPRWSMGRCTSKSWYVGPLTRNRGSPLGV